MIEQHESAGREPAPEPPLAEPFALLKRVRAFIEYARYVLEEGKATFPDQFPKQGDADEAMQRLDQAVAALRVGPPEFIDEEFPSHDFQPLPDGRGDHPHCTRCHVPEHSSEAGWREGRCTKRTFRVGPPRADNWQVLVNKSITYQPVAALDRSQEDGKP